MDARRSVTLRLKGPRRTVTMSIEVDAWVKPYLQLFTRLGLGDRAGRVVGQFVAEHGSRITS